MRQLHRITYANVEKDEAARLYRCRDGMAFCELFAALAPEGFQYGTTWYFYPGDQSSSGEFPPCQAGDAIVLPTRPPLDDPSDRKDPERWGPRKIILRAGSAHEQAIFKAVRRFIKYGTRKRVQLTARAKALLRPEHRARMAFVEFYENRGNGHEYSGAQIQRHFVGRGHEPVKPGSSRPSTIGFLIRVGPLPGLAGELIVSFGMDGYSTLIWNRILRTRHPEWLQNRGFLMAELVFRQPVPDSPVTVEFADDPARIEVRLLTKMSGPGTAHA